MRWIGDTPIFRWNVKTLEKIPPFLRRYTFHLLFQYLQNVTSFHHRLTHANRAKQWTVVCEWDCAQWLQYSGLGMRLCTMATVHQTGLGMRQCEMTTGCLPWSKHGLVHPLPWYVSWGRRWETDSTDRSHCWWGRQTFYEGCYRAV